VLPRLWRSWVPWVVGLLEQREVAARRRVEADWIQAELAVADQEWNEWALPAYGSVRCWSRGRDGAGP
jgi:hypothetical protein